MSIINSCTFCGLPISHGASGYQCRCGFSWKPSYDHNALADLLKERDQLKAEVERLNADLKIALSFNGIGLTELFNERDQLKEQLAEAPQPPVQEPVGYVKYNSPIKGHTEFFLHEEWCNDGLSEGWVPLYAAPQTCDDAWLERNKE